MLAAPQKSSPERSLMMQKRLVPAGMVAIAVVIAGSSSSPAQAAPLDDTTCTNIAFAKDALMMSSTSETARNYADELEQYNPPDAVQAAIEHFVTTGGGRIDDPDNRANNQVINKWLKQMCPNVTEY
jgi:uncharacterized protein YccT (UPF0319 family)